MHYVLMQYNLPGMIIVFLQSYNNLFYKNGLLECLFIGDVDPTYTSKTNY